MLRGTVCLWSYEQSESLCSVQSLKHIVRKSMAPVARPLGLGHRSVFANK